MRTFHVHPHIGLEGETDGVLDARTLIPAGWHGGSEDEQLDLEEGFLERTLSFFAGADAEFEADMPYPEDVRRLRRAAATAGVELSAEGRSRWGFRRVPACWCGPLVPGLAGAFPARSQLVLDVKVAGVPRVHLHDDVEELYVELARREVASFLRFLRDGGFHLSERRD